MSQERWDKHFLDIARSVSEMSKDPSTKCGAVIVRPDRSIASTGFNGFPRRLPDRDEDYQDRDLKLAQIIHAEMNAILHAHESLEGYTIYTHQTPMIGCSCDRCSAHIIQAGIVRVVTEKVRIPERWFDSITRSLTMYGEAGVEVVSY